MKKLKKNLTIISLILIFIFIISLNVNKTYATDISSDTTRLIKTSSTINPDDYNPENFTAAGADKIVDKIGVILGAVRNISVVTSVIVLMIIGIKYMLGSVEEKANYKATMWPYIIGCLMASAGTTLVDFIYNAVH